MEHSRFKLLTGQLDLLSESQLRKIKEKILKIEAHHSVSKTLENSKSAYCCPHCRSSQVVRWGYQTDMQRYRCKNCHKTFNALSGTPLAKLRRRGHWWDLCECLIKGYSLRKTASICKIDLTTAFRWRHRFLQNHASYNPRLLAGIVEVDIATIPTPRRNSGDRVTKKKTSVLFSMDRYKVTSDSILHNMNYNKVKKIIQHRLAPDSLVYAHSQKLERELLGSLKYYKPFSKESSKIAYTYQYEESLKNWLAKFRGVSQGYLVNYLSWYRSLNEFNQKASRKDFLVRAKESNSRFNFKHKHNSFEMNLLNPTPPPSSNP